MSTHQMLVERDGQTLRFTADFSPGTPDVMYLPNGDPGDPGDPEEFAVTLIELQVRVADDLDCHPNCKRTFWLDVTDLLYGLTQDEGEMLNDLAYQQLVADSAEARDAADEARAEAAQEWRNLP